VAATTTPAGLTVAVTYDGAAEAPAEPGSYAVVATVTDRNHNGAAAGTLTIVASPYAEWRRAHFTPEQIAAGLAGEEEDPDRDGRTNRFEFAFRGDPLAGGERGLFHTRAADGGAPGLLFTCAVRRGAAFAPAPDRRLVSAAVDGIVYTIEAAADPGGPWDAEPAEQGASDTAPAGSGLPDLTGTGWHYRTFAAFPGLPGSGFLRAGVAKP
jgi:hypothetical protein